MDKFAEALVTRSIESLKDDIQTLRRNPDVPILRAAEKREMQPRAVGVERAAELLSLSPWTIRKYVAERRLHSIRAGRRVLVPMETVEKVLREGVPPVGK